MPKITIPSQLLSRLSKDQQITELNSTVKCKLAPSPIDGVGVFAIRDINAGDRCYITPRIMPKFYNIPFGSLSKLFPEVKELVLSHWASVVNSSIFQSPNDDVGLLFFCNHSYEDYNYDVGTDTALRDIKIGEEVLENYFYMENAEKVYKWLKCDENDIKRI